MPWTSRSARSHTKKAKSAGAKRQWSKVANKLLKSGASEGKAIRIANAAVKNRRKRK